MIGIKGYQGKSMSNEGSISNDWFFVRIKKTPNIYH